MSVRTAQAAPSEPSAADKETSRSLYVEGARLLEAHDYAGAERSCRGAHAIIRVPTSSACLARALEGLGRLVEARDAFLEATRYPVAPGEPQVFTDARDASSGEAESLSRRIPTIVLDVAGPPERTRLRASIDGAAVAPETVRLPRKVDPGRHVVIVFAAGFRQARVEVTAAEGQEQHVGVDLQPSQVDATQQPVASSAVSPTASSISPLAYVAWGVGVAGLATGIGIGLAAGSKDSTLAGECTGTSCPPSARGDLDSFHTLKTISTISYVVGAAGAVGGFAFWFALRPAHSAEPAARLWFGPASACVAGTF
ncbi:MAG: hypothetical protein ACRENE_35525 [Polyangiaceae bacterium]